nr:hypothetical protein [Actinomadura madurae]
MDDVVPQVAAAPVAPHRREVARDDRVDRGVPRRVRADLESRVVSDPDEFVQARDLLLDRVPLRHEAAVAAVEIGLVQPRGLGGGRDAVPEDLDPGDAQHAGVHAARRPVGAEHVAQPGGGRARRQQHVDPEAEFARPRLPLVQGEPAEVDPGIGDAGDAEAVEHLDGTVEGAGDLVVGEGRDVRGDQVPRGLPQDSGGLAVGVLLDHAAGRRPGVAGDAAIRSTTELTATACAEKSRRTTGWSPETGSRSVLRGGRGSRLSFHPWPRIQAPGAASDAAVRTAATSSSIVAVSTSMVNGG